MSLPRITGESLTQTVYRRLKSDILELELLPRQPLIEAELAKEFGVSKTPVREALLMLLREGLVESTTFHTVVVRDFALSDVLEMYELRRVLEPLALSCAMPNMTSDDFRELSHTLDSARTAVDEADARELSALNRRFHQQLIARCTNRLMLESLNSFNDRLRLISLRYWNVHPTYMREAEQHESILAAVTDRDVKVACRLLTEHIDEFAEGYRRSARDQSVASL